LVIEPRAGAKLSARGGRVRNAEMLWLLRANQFADFTAMGAAQQQLKEEHVALRLRQCMAAKLEKNELIEVPRWLNCMS